MTRRPDLATGPADERPPRSSFALIFDRNFGLWFWGNAFSNMGSWVFNVVAVVVVYDYSGSALQVGLVSVAQFASPTLVSPWAGAIADRFDRLRMILAGQVFAAAAAVGIAIPTVILGVDGLPGTWPVLLAALGIGMGKSFAGPSANSLVPALVPDADLESAVSLTQLTYNVGRAMGPVVAGVVLSTVGPAIGFAVNAVSFVLFIVALLALRIRPRPRPGGGMDGSVRAGLHYVLRDRAMILILLGASASGFAADPVITLSPPLAERLGGSDTLVATMISAFGILATVAAFGSARLQRHFGSQEVARKGMLLMAGGLALAALAPTAPVAVLGFALNGVGYSLGITSFTSMLQRRVPDHMRGRVMALWIVAFLGSRPAAATLHGAAADLTSAAAAIWIAVLVALAGALVAQRLLRHLAEPPEQLAGASVG